MTTRMLLSLATVMAVETLPIAAKMFTEGRSELMKDGKMNHAAAAQTVVGAGLLLTSFHFAKEAASLEQLRTGSEFIRTTVQRMFSTLDAQTPLDPCADVWPTVPVDRTTPPAPAGGPRAPTTPPAPAGGPRAPTTPPAPAGAPPAPPPTGMQF